MLGVRLLVSAEIFWFPNNKVGTSIFGMTVYNTCSLEVYMQNGIENHKQICSVRDN
jgi:hypothetical protein